MTTIGLISDTHGHLDPAVERHFNKVDEIWHAGDIGGPEVIAGLEQLAPVRAVYGNIDGGEIRRSHPMDQFFTCESVKVWITHIGGYPGRYHKRIREWLAENAPPDLFICGHSHILKVMNDTRYGFLHMNPGAAGYSGFHKVMTLLRFRIDGSRITDLEVIELGPRARRL